MYHFYVQGGRGEEGVGKGMPVPVTITEQTKILLQTKLMVS